MSKLECVGGMGGSLVSESSKFNKFEHLTGGGGGRAYPVQRRRVWGPVQRKRVWGPVHRKRGYGPLQKPPLLLSKMTDTTENITFPLLSYKTMTNTFSLLP